MNQKELAEGLRRRQTQYHSARLLNKLSDDDIILNYIYCSRCGKPILKRLESTIAEVNTAGEFVELCNRLLESHNCA